MDSTAIDDYLTMLLDQEYNTLIEDGSLETVEDFFFLIVYDQTIHSLGVQAAH